jgi:hypothetical protein
MIKRQYGYGEGVQSPFDNEHDTVNHAVFAFQSMISELEIDSSCGMSASQL